MAERIEFTVSALYLETGKDRRIIDQALADNKVQPVRTEGTIRYYHLKDVLPALYEGASLNQAHENAKLKRAQTVKTELEIAKLEGALVPIEEVENDASQTAMMVKAKLQSIPARLAGTLAGIQDENDIEAILEQELIEVLEELHTEKWESSQTPSESTSDPGDQ